MRAQSINGRMAVFMIAAVLFAAAGAAQTVAAKYEPRADENWFTYENARFGYRFYYPSAHFQDGNPSDDGGGMSFASNDGRARIVVFGANNDQKLSLTEYRRLLLEDIGGYEQLTYQPTGDSWFVLSGFRRDNIYYQKVMFSCSDKIINIFSMTFPAAEKPFYERLIEIMEDNFKPARGADAPEGC